MYVQRFKNFETAGSLLGAALVGLVSLSVGCSADMADCIVKCKSELHAFSEHGSHLVSAISEEGTEAIDVESEATESPESKIEPASEPSPSGEEAEAAKSETPSLEASTEKTTDVDPVKAKESLSGELGEKDFEEPATLEKPTPVLPEGSPKWTTAGNNFTENTHRLVVNTAPCNTYEESLAKLPDHAFLEFVKYSKSILGIDVGEFKSITPDWITQRLIKGKESEFVAEGMKDNSPTYTAWAKLEIDPETRSELEGMHRRLQWYPRSARVGSFMLSAIAFFGLAHVGFNLISSVQTKKK